MTRALFAAPLLLAACAPDARPLPASCDVALDGSVVCAAEDVLTRPDAALTLAADGDAIVVAATRIGGPSDGELVLVDDAGARVVGGTSGLVADVALTSDAIVWLTRDGAARLELQPLGGGPSRLLAETPAGARLAVRRGVAYWTGMNDGVAYVALDGSVASHVPLPTAARPGTWALALHDAAGVVYARQFDGIAISVADASGAHLTALFDGGLSGTSPSEAPWTFDLAVSGERVYFAFDGALFEAPITGDLPARRVVEGLGDVRGTAATDDGAIAWTDYEAGELWALDVNTRRATRLLAGLTHPSTVRAAGEWLAWAEEGRVRRLSTLSLSR